MPSSALSYDLRSAAASPALFRASLERSDTCRAYALHHVRSFSRGSVEVRSGGWIIAIANGMSVVARVREIIELFVPGGPVLRATLSEAREVRFEDTTRGCVISVPRTQPAADMYACLENMSVHEVSCDDRDPSVLTFNYIY